MGKVAEDFAVQANLKDVPKDPLKSDLYRVMYTQYLYDRVASEGDLATKIPTSFDMVRPSHLIIDPTMASNIVTDSQNFGRSSIYDGPRLGFGYSSLSAEVGSKKWVEMRKLSQPELIEKSMSDFNELIYENVNKAIAGILREGVIKDGIMDRVMKEITVPIIFKIFGVVEKGMEELEGNMGNLEDKNNVISKIISRSMDGKIEMSRDFMFQIAQHVHQSILAGTIAALFPIPVLKHIAILIGRVHYNTGGTLGAFKEILKLAQEDAEIENDHPGIKKQLGFLQNAIEKLEKGEITETMFYGDLATFVEAGGETTASAISSIFVELGENPKMQEDLIQVMSKYDLDNPTPEILEALLKDPVLDIHFLELMRLHPAVFLNSRKTKDDYIYNGYTIPKNRIAAIPTFALQRSEHAGWVDGNEYNPYKHFQADENGKYIPIGGIFYKPFTEGYKGSCPGKPNAVRQVKYAIASIAWQLGKNNQRLKANGEIIRGSSPNFTLLDIFGDSTVTVENLEQAA